MLAGDSELLTGVMASDIAGDVSAHIRYSSAGGGF